MSPEPARPRASGRRPRHTREAMSWLQTSLGCVGQHPAIAPAVSAIFVSAWVSAVAIASLGCQWLADRHAYGSHTRVQIAGAVGLCVAIATWAATEVALQSLPRLIVYFGSAAKAVPTEDEESEHAVPKGADLEAAAAQATVVGRAVEGAAAPKKLSKVSMNGSDNGFLPAALGPLRAGAELAAIMAFVYLCDRTEVFSKETKVYDPPSFWGLWLVICIVALFTVQKLESTKPLQREQTDEWKGWMQLMFLMYHYFAEKEVYNAIRVYIACYVWMTGYGNFCLYGRKDAFSMKRTLHVLFRLNLLGTVTCIILTNEYMLYYICAMHTIFTLFVMAALYVKRELNNSTRCVYVKIVVLFVLTAVLYDGPEVIFKAVFGTLPIIRPLAAFHDPLHPEFTNEMHEWHFRSGLDRFIWIVGMIMALHVEHFTAFIAWLEDHPLPQRLSYSVGVLMAVLVVGGLWWQNVFMLHKYDYNKCHPYTSALPIACFLLLRNCVPFLRQRYLYFFAFLGKYTLETYIFQFHIWMRTTGLNGSPKFLLVWIPGHYWANFALLSVVYLGISVRFFKLTAVLSESLVRKEPKEQGVVLACAACCWALCYSMAQLFEIGA